MFWERWILPITISNEKFKSQLERDRKNSARVKEVISALKEVVMYAEKMSHLPPMKAKVENKESMVTYPFEVRTGGNTLSKTSYINDANHAHSDLILILCCTDNVSNW